MDRRKALRRIAVALGGVVAAAPRLSSGKGAAGGFATAGLDRRGAGLRTAAPPGITSLTNARVRYSVPAKDYVVLGQRAIQAIVVNNAAVDEPPLRGHRAGYHGLASLTHERREQNLFVPAFGGLNFEFIHNGTPADMDVLFEPRRAPMELRVIDERTVELYQPPTPNWKLESCGRYRLRPDGTLDYTFECIPRARTFTNGYIGLFWANYIHEPADKAIYFRGRSASAREGRTRWIRAVSPEHGVCSTHPPAEPLPELRFHRDFPLRLVSSRSAYVYSEPWYYGISHNMTYVLMFRATDGIWFAQSPDGGGEANPAWDFQWFIPGFEVDQPYGFTMRVAYMPFEDRVQLARATQRDREMLSR